MTEELTATVSVDIEAPARAVWHALTDPDKIRQYLFGTHTVCDWQVGSKITYSGEWQGKAGGYAIQGKAEVFVRFLSGSHSNVVGLPLFETRSLLQAARVACRP